MDSCLVLFLELGRGDVDKMLNRLVTVAILCEQVFDGHGGMDAACYVRKNILKFIVEDSQFPGCVKKAIRNAYVKADQAFAENSILDVSSGTTALTTLVFGR